MNRDSPAGQTAPAIDTWIARASASAEPKVSASIRASVTSTVTERSRATYSPRDRPPACADASPQKRTHPTAIAPTMPKCARLALPSRTGMEILEQATGLGGGREVELRIEGEGASDERPSARPLALRDADRAGMVDEACVGRSPARGDVDRAPRVGDAAAPVERPRVGVLGVRGVARGSLAVRERERQGSVTALRRLEQRQRPGIAPSPVALDEVV